MAKIKLTQQRLKEVLVYNSETGEFTWSVKTSKYSPVKVGDIAGCSDDEGYNVVMVDGKRYKSHRLVWFYNFGVFPKEQIDHIDGNKSNNRLGNLREVSGSRNAKNQKMFSTNSSGITGVSVQKVTRECGKVYENWVAQWSDSSGKLNIKSFSILKYGYEVAKELAIVIRNEKIRELNILGAGYTERHGLPLDCTGGSADV